ncbi:MAG: aryl-sulfate sulfotransferase [Planctomycetes bacterium]|nr:aryl-sulfate sulfotransferase [Planctomycetota bacterium]
MSRPRRVRRPPALLLLAALVGCGGDAASPAPPADGTHAEAPADDDALAPDDELAERGGVDLDALRALGYAGESEDVVDAVGVTLLDPARSSPGYNLYTVRPLCTAVLMDAAGTPLRRWSQPRQRTWSNAQLLPGGELLVVTQERSRTYTGVMDEHRALLRFAWDGTLLQRIALPTHHDVEITPAGDIATLSFRRVSGHPLAPAGVDLREDLVVRLDAEGRVLDERSILAALTSGGAPYELQEVAPHEEGGVRFVDLVHANALEFAKVPALEGQHPLYGPGTVLVTMRHQDAVCAFRWETGELVWSWGHGELSGPHDGQVLPSGNVLLLDNGLARGWSRAVEMDPRTGAIVWEYRADPPEAFYTASRGSVQRLPNGNTLICESDRGRAFEVTPAGERVWQWTNPELAPSGKTTTVVRMKRLPLEYVDAIQAARR